MDDKKCLIIYNPNSGKGMNPKIMDEYRKLLNENGYMVDFLGTRYSGHAKDVVRDALGYDIVFSIGGDGTLNEVVSGNSLREDKFIICPLPSGTCNDVATMLGYNGNPILNLKKALDGEVHSIDFGLINDKAFIYVAGMGKLMNIPYETKREDKLKDGYLAYIKAGLSEFSHRFKRYRSEIEVDGVNLDGKYSLIMVSNANHIAGIDGFHKNVCLDDGELEVVLCKSKNIKDFAGNFMMFLLGQKTEDIVSLKAKEVKIKIHDKLDKNWCVDGDEYIDDSKEFIIRVGGQMNFLTPKIKNKSLFKK